jgi:hypothetical protein
MAYIIGGVIGLLIAVAFIIGGIRGKTLIVSRDDTGQSAPVSGSPNWLMIIIGVVVAISSIGGIIKGASGH